MPQWSLLQLGKLEARMLRQCNVLRKRWFLLSFICFVVLLFIIELKVSKFSGGTIFDPLRVRNVLENDSNEPSVGPAEDLVVFYNRIPKTGSTSFVNVAYDLCVKNSFHVIHLNVTKNSHTMALADQARFVNNITRWNAKTPALYHGHVGFINFRNFGARQPIYVNILRKPLDRLVSYYYFLRYGDNYRPHLIRRKHGNKVTFDDCVKLKKPDCHPDNMWLQIPFLCGQNAFCWIPGNEWALQEAKRNLVKEYLLVGITEDIQGFISVLEAVLPTFFKGATEHFASSQKSHLRKTNKKIEPSAQTVAEIEKSKIWQMENELYQFAAQQFQFVKSQMKFYENGTAVDRGTQFRFEKIYPKSTT